MPKQKGYHLSTVHITVHLLLPTLSANVCDISKRAAYNTEYTWHYSTQGLPALCITAQCRGPLPHIFTFILPLRLGKLFSVALSLTPLSRGSRLFTGGLPYAVQTFLIPTKSARDSQVYSKCKNNLFKLRNITNGNELHELRK